MSIRTRLLVLVIAILVPVMMGAAWGLVQMYKQQRAVAESSLYELVRALSSVVANELAKREAVLLTLAGSPALARDDLAAFHDFVTAVLPESDRAIVLSDSSGRQLLNSRVKFGSPSLPERSTVTEMRRKSGWDPLATFVSDLYFAPIGKQHSFAIQVPIVREGQAVYYLAMGSFAETLQGLVSSARLREGWNAAIFDRQGIAVARRMEPQKFVGTPGSNEMLDRFRRSREGLVESVRMDGSQALTAYSTIGDTGWTFVVSMPKSELSESLYSAIGTTLIITIALFVVAVGGALIAGLNISRPLRDLARQAAALGSGERVQPGQYRLVEADLVAAQLAHASAAIHRANRDLEKRVETAVTETRRMQEAVLQNQKLEALGRLTGGIAHDFNNLLQAISMAVELTRLKSTDPVITKAMEGARGAVHSGATLTRQLMTFGRAQPASRQTVDISSEIQSVRDLITGALRRDIELKVQLRQGLWPVTVDRVQFELAILNLCFNARDAMPGGGVLTISAENIVVDDDRLGGLAPGDYLRLQVEDTGDGIPEELQPKVFDPFFTTKDIGKGSGLGLAQVYGFATSSGGIASIRSVQGSGTSVFLWLPREPVAVPQCDDVSDTFHLPLAEQRTVLLVEDDVSVREMVAPALQNAGFQVLHAGDVASALAVLGNNVGTIDIVFSDIVMPGGRSGIDLANEMKRRFPDVPVVLATGYSYEPSVGVPCLMKPYNIEVLVDLLRKAMKEAALLPRAARHRV